MYLAMMTRLDIAYIVALLARFNHNLGEEHWKAVNHLFQYLKGTLDMKGHRASERLFFLASPCWVCLEDRYSSHSTIQRLLATSTCLLNRPKLHLQAPSLTFMSFPWLMLMEDTLFTPKRCLIQTRSMSVMIWPCLSSKLMPCISGFPYPCLISRSWMFLTTELLNTTQSQWM